MQRKDVDPIDIAKALKKLADRMGGTSRKFAETVSARLGITDRMIWNYLSLLNLAPEVQEMVSESKLGVKIASQLATVEREKQEMICIHFYFSFFSKNNSSIPFCFAISMNFSLA